MLIPRGHIKKENLTIAAKFFWLLFCHSLSLTTIDNIPTFDRAVLVAAIVARSEMHGLLISVIYERT